MKEVQQPSEMLRHGRPVAEPSKVGSSKYSSTDRIPRALQAGETEDPLRRLSRLGRRRGEKFRLRPIWANR
jgi:hypothetical protein